MNCLIEINVRINPAPFDTKLIDELIGVLEYQLTRAISDKLKTELPSIGGSTHKLTEPHIDLEKAFNEGI